MTDDDSLVGQRIGVYELQALIGAGGMGRVYRARDTRLQRDVAVKVLPPSVTGDSERLTRFEREARMLASLNHPNIGAIYGVEDHPPALILELIDGLTLADRIAEGPLPIPECLGLARQIAIALDAAHEKNIIHRDLKPANIKVTPDGTVKILDFGIAKAVNLDPHGATTIAAVDTRAGVVIGTAAYMSPEQARGMTVDKRTDIWAFGCVLFEMLSGQSPFAGPTTSDTIAATLEREPPWSSLPPTLPARVRELLRRCLEKDPRQRLRDIGDAVLELEHRRAARAGGSRRRGYLIGASIAAAAIIAVAAWLFLPFNRWLRPAALPESRIVIDDIELESPHVAFSPDGASLVIEPRFDRQDERLLIIKPGSTDRRALPGTEGGLFPFWSPDGRSIGFFAGRKLKRIDLVGETVQEIADAPIGRGGAWTADGSILFAPAATGPLYQVAASGGQPVALTALAPGQNDHRAPIILPGGRHFIYYARGSATGRGVYVANIDGSEPRRLLDAAAAAVYTPTGHLLFARENQLLAQRFDPATLTLDGEPFRVAENISLNRGVSLATLAASSAGAFAYATASTTRLQFAWFDRSGVEIGRVGTPDASPVTNPALSPDGRTLAFARLMEGNWDIWLMEMSRGVMTRLTSEANLDFVPVWMTDNTRIIYQSVRGVEPDLFRRALGANAELLVKTPGGKTPMDVSRDGRFLLFGSATSETNTDIWMMPLDGSGPPQSLVATSFVESGAQFSADGRWIAYSSNETGRFEIYVRPLSGPSPPRRVSTAGGNLARWSHAGNELFYVAPDGNLMSVSVTGFASRQLSIGTPAPLFRAPLDPSGFSTRSPVVVSIDDQRFLMPIAIDKPTPSTLILVLNWRPPS